MTTSNTSDTAAVPWGKIGLMALGMLVVGFTGTYLILPKPPVRAPTTRNT